jgi:hypothetical protein
MSTKRALVRATELLQTRKADVRLFYGRSLEKATEPGPLGGRGTTPADYEI